LLALVGFHGLNSIPDSLALLLGKSGSDSEQHFRIAILNHIRTLDEV
jgi:hypothetical protein